MKHHVALTHANKCDEKALGMDEVQAQIVYLDFLVELCHEQYSTPTNLTATVG